MAIRLAWHDLIHRRVRTGVALAGVSFAIILIFMQIGFYMACRASAIRVHDLLEFDLLMTSQQYSFIIESGSLPRERLEQARAHDQVETASPLYIGADLWRNTDSGNAYDLVVLAVDPARPPFRSPEVNALVPLLKARDTLLFDRAAHPILGNNVPGTRSQLAGRSLRVVANFEWGSGFVADGMAVTSEASFRHLFRRAPGTMQLGLIELRQDADAEQVAAELTARLPADVRIWTRDAIEQRDRRFFLGERPIGLMFTSGALLAVVVGAVILFQILSSEVTSRQTEFATLQALGYSQRAVYRVVFELGALYCLVAFIPAVAVSLVMFSVTRSLARLPMTLGPGLMLGVFLLTGLICVVGAMGASYRVRNVDPAELF